MSPDHRLIFTRVVVNVSGGKDSAAAALHLREQGVEYDAIFADTGWEARETYDYLRGPLEEAIGPIRWLRAEVDLPPDREAMAQELEAMLGHYSAMVRLCLKKMMMPARQVRWCTQAAKVEPIHRWLDALDEPVVSVVGIRHDESEARAKMEEWEWSDKLDRWTWRPIIRWSLDEVIAIHARHGLRPNPLYLRGATRVGCWPCIFARKAEIRMLADTDPARVEVMRRLEEMVCSVGRQRSIDNGNVPREDYSWFQADSKASDGGFSWPIDRVVEWSRTSRGGKQIELFAANPADAGCARWGLCEVGDTKGLAELVAEGVRAPEREGAA